MVGSWIDWLLVVRVKKPIFQGYFSIDFIQRKFLKNFKTVFKVNKYLRIICSGDRTTLRVRIHVWLWIRQSVKVG